MSAKYFLLLLVFSGVSCRPKVADNRKLFTKSLKLRDSRMGSYLPDSDEFYDSADQPQNEIENFEQYEFEIPVMGYEPVGEFQRTPNQVRMAEGSKSGDYNPWIYEMLLNSLVERLRKDKDVTINGKQLKPHQTFSQRLKGVTNTRPEHHQQKGCQKTMTVDRHTMSCSTIIERKILQFSYNTDYQQVKIIEGEELQSTYPHLKQEVHVHSCADNCSRCKGVSGNSRCIMQSTFSQLYHRVRLNHQDPPIWGEPQWGLVEVPSHCVCELLPEGVNDDFCPPH